MNLFCKASLTIGSTKESMVPPIEAISLTKVEERKENFAFGVRKTLSRSGDIALFMLAN